MKPITLTVYKPKPCRAHCIGTTRISEPAEKALLALQKSTGLPLRHIASELILQAAAQVKINTIETDY